MNSNTTIKDIHMGHPSGTEMARNLNYATQSIGSKDELKNLHLDL